MSDELPPLPEDVASLLRALPTPTPIAPGAQARVLERVTQSLAAPAAVGAGAAASVARGVSAKVVAAVVAVTAVASGLGGFVYGRATAPVPEQPRVEVPVVAPAPRVETPPTVPVVEVPVAPAPAPAPAPVEPVRVAAPDGRQVIEATRTALLKGDAPRALELVAEHARRFPNSQLAEERGALEIQALLLAGETARAREAAKAFKARWKNSVFLPVAEAALEN